MTQKTIPPRQIAGFTLVELLLSMALMSGFLVILTGIFESSLSIQNETQATSSVNIDGRFMLARLTYDINRADSITTPATLGATSANLVLVIGGITNTYALSGNSLQLTNSAAATPLNSPDVVVSAPSFKRYGNSGGKETIQFSFTLTGTDRDSQGTRTQTFTSTVGRR